VIQVTKTFEFCGVKPGLLELSQSTSHNTVDFL